MNIKERTKEWWKKNLANVVTTCGMISAVLYIITVWREANEILVLIAYAVITCITDNIDGRIARRNDAVSVFGSYIDRIRDRLFIYIGFPSTVWQHKEEVIFPELLICLTAVLLFFEALIFRIGFVGYRWYRKGKNIDIQPNEYGQRKMFVGFTIMLIFLFSLYLEQQELVVLKYSMWLIYLGLVLMTYWSCVSWKEYAQRERRFRKEDKQGHIPDREKRAQ